MEIGDWTRFTGSSIGAYVGLVPTEYSSGASSGAGIDHQSRQRPRATAVDRSGLASSRLLPHLRATMRARWAKVDPALKARGHAGNQRLHQQWCRFNERKKPRVVANVAIARQLAGWCWSLATLT